MKKIILALLGIISLTASYGQNISDALRYSTENTQGTARYKAMSGAFGALGGDISAVSVNPAGSALFNLSHGSLSLSNRSISNVVGYSGSSTKENKDNFDLNQIGAAFVFKNKNDASLWNKFVLSIFYEQLDNYDDNFLATGVSSNSIGSYFTDYANGLRLDEISALTGESISDAYSNIGYDYGSRFQQAYLGYESYILEPESENDDNSAYTSNIAPGNFDQEYYYSSTGYNGKFSVNAGFQYDKNIYFGMTLNSHFIDYERITYLNEENTNIGSTVNQVDFENTLLTTGEGFSLQLGTIIKLSDAFRVGLTYDSPTWITLRDETTQFISTENDTDNTRTVVNPDVINLFQDYKIQTPAKITGSAAYIIGETGLISIDYSRKDYSKTKLKPESEIAFSQQNTLISNALKAADTFRIGGELRHQKYSFRGGYKIEQSPYSDTSVYGDLKGFSLGLGYNFGNSRIDLAYENSKRETDYQLFNAGTLGAAKINATNTHVSITLSMNL